MAKVEKLTKDDFQVETNIVNVKLLKAYQLPHGALKKEGHILEVSPEYAAELINEGIAEILKTK